jgi:LmbE family N-acetylglucosaminyl deacetylase
MKNVCEYRAVLLNNRFVVARLLSLFCTVGTLAGCDVPPTVAQEPVVSSQDGQVIAALKDAKRVLWLAAHPDDETSSSGLLARVKDLGGALYMVSLTSGENSDVLWGGLQRGSQIGEARAELFARSASLLRADAHQMGPFVNGPFSRTELNRLPARSPHRDWSPTATSDDVIAKWTTEGDPLGYLVTVLRQVKPDAVVTMDYHCGVSGHGEHRAVGKLLMQAIPLAGAAATYPEAGHPWKVRHIIFPASVIPQLVACRYCKCEGPDLPEPVEQIMSVERSVLYGMTYFGMSCLIARTYENAMASKGWSEDGIRSGCEQADQAALRAIRAGDKDPRFFLAFRVRALQ